MSEASAITNNGPEQAGLPPEESAGTENPGDYHTQHKPFVTGYVVGGRRFSSLTDAAQFVFLQAAENFEKAGVHALELMTQVNDYVGRATEWMKRLKEDGDNHLSKTEAKDVENLLKSIGAWDDKTAEALYKGGDLKVTGKEAKVLNAALDGFVSTAQSRASVLMARMSSLNKTKDSFIQGDAGILKQLNDTLNHIVSKSY